jgi:hypothetical protein
LARSAGEKIESPIADSPWGSYFGMFRDKFGIEWMVDFNPEYSRKIQAKNNECLTNRCSTVTLSSTGRLSSLR